MNPRTHANPYLSNSLAIRQEIQRFESVHPSIYALYDLIEAIPDMLIQQQIREHVVCIEDSFVNSQEWTLSRGVPDLKLGILGTINSGKSALVHRYLTGSYLQEESPEGGRFKKEVVLDGQSYLLLIRDEGGLPEVQFTHWVDAVIFVFSLENEVSFNAIYTYYAKMAHFHANIADVPVILVGTQDAISESNPRVIDDTRARKLASDLKRCAYYETCATYGLNVERVFQDACQKIVQTRLSTAAIGGGRSNTPNHISGVRSYHTQQSCPPPPLPPYPASHGAGGAGGGGRSYDAQSHSSSGSGSAVAPLTPTGMAGGHHIQGPSPPFQDGGPGVREKDPSRDFRQGDRRYREHRERDIQAQCEDPARAAAARSQRHAVSVPIPTVPDSGPQSMSHMMYGADMPPCVLPPMPVDLQRSDEVDKGMKSKSGEVGSGRVIPIKQGMLYKKSSKPLSKEWKKKYVTLLDDGRLTYHPSLHDYMDNVRGKEVNLLRTTVKIPGQRPRGSEAPKPAQSNGQSAGSADSSKDGISAESLVISNTSLAPAVGAAPVASSTPPTVAKAELPSVKKRPKRSKGGAKGDGGPDGDSDGFEFMVVSLDNSTWHFEAQSQEERDEWVQAIEQQILSSLQLNLSDKSKNRSATVTDRGVIQTIRSVHGNHSCADCDCPNPDWASLNLGVLVCIECSGIHRNLGTHVSRVRSLDLDEWPPELVITMTTIGNHTANSIWEANSKGRTKPTPSSPREEKEKWVRAKYEQKEFLPPPPYLDVPLPQQLIDAVARQDVHNTILVLGYCKSDHVNTPYSKSDTRTALHIAAALGNLVLVQLLLWYGANAKAIDHEGHNALYYARGANAVDCVELLRTQGCPENPTLPRRRISNPPPGGSGGSASSGGSGSGGNAGGSGEIFDKLPASVI